jgi:four helix bundle protein
MSLIVHQVALEMVTGIKPLIDRVARHDRSLATQMRRSASSVALNIGEAAYSRGGNQTARFQDAAGSASETRSALQVAAAWGYLSCSTCEPVDAKLDRILAMLWGLTRRKSQEKRLHPKKM